MDRDEFDRLMAIAGDREIEAHQFYRDVAERMSDNTVKETFAQLAKEELEHRDLLARYKADPTMVMKISAPVLDTRVAEATEEPVLSVRMKPADAVALAMKKEQQAVEFYRELSAGSSDKEVGAVFENLANMELGHKQRLENVFIDIGYPESF